MSGLEQSHHGHRTGYYNRSIDKDLKYCNDCQAFFYDSAKIKMPKPRGNGFWFLVFVGAIIGGVAAAIAKDLVIDYLSKLWG